MTSDSSDLITFLKQDRRKIEIYENIHFQHNASNLNTEYMALVTPDKAIYVVGKVSRDTLSVFHLPIHWTGNMLEQRCAGLCDHTAEKGIHALYLLPAQIPISMYIGGMDSFMSNPNVSISQELN